MTAAAAAAPAETFDALGLSAAALHALAQASYQKPTPIQAKAIPHVLAGRDVIGCAATGTGKTAAFVLPLLERLASKQLHRALVLVPTRELANQISEHVERFGAARGMRCATLIGGVGMGGQLAELRADPQLIIATPGRLIDHLEQRTVKVDSVDALVLDEADRMLDMGFKPQLTRILQRLPRNRQTLLFSATMAGEVAEFARQSLHQPVRVEVNTSGTLAARATQKVYELQQTEKTALLITLLDSSDDSTLVFTRTKRRADKVARSLERAGLSVERIHADRSQGQRERALDGFKNGTYRVLVATDIAARGIDVADIGHVVIYDLPHVPADYVHRIGRTARAAATGRASSFVAPEEMDLLRAIEKLTKTPVPREKVPRDSEVFQRESAAEAARKEHGGGGGGGGGHHARGRQQHHAKKPHGSGGGRHGGGGKRHGGGGGGGPKQHSASSGGGSGSGKSVFSGGPRRRR
ncbi:MAG: DEAD/DEAH box helicase [Archangiaceae bacterium]|nr:DEAD/DEAH box helicase [Archangiaceae bacterium]